MLEWAEKFNEAEKDNDLPLMQQIAEKMYSFARELELDERGRKLLTGANIKLGVIYSHQKKRSEAFKALDAAIAMSPDESSVLYAYNLKLSYFFSPEYAEEIHKIMTDCRRYYEKVNMSRSGSPIGEVKASLLIPVVTLVEAIDLPEA